MLIVQIGSISFPARYFTFNFSFWRFWAGAVDMFGGYGFAHGEPGAKKALAGVAAGTGIAVLAVNVLSWPWGV